MMKRIILGCCLLLNFICQQSHAQLSAADSAYFLGVFTNPLYIDTNVNPGNWFNYGPITTMYNHYLILDTNFKFTTADLDSIDYLTIDDSLHQDISINNSFAQFPNLLSQQNPIVYLPYTFKQKHSKAHAILYPDTTNPHCRYAFLLVPGTGTNASYDIVRGLGYHNQLCQMKDNCRNFGDVYTFVKPNEEHRAVYWNGLKLNEYIVNYLITQNTRYGTNYLIEMIAMVKYLKSKYDKVFLFGLSEGGYSATLCTMYIEPDAALISGGYSINFDSCIVEKDILKTRFDYLLDTFDRVKVKNRISQSTTQYLFTYGENDPVLTMDPEHDYHYTQTYFNGLSNCSFFYNFNDHTFPPCADIDTFIQRIISPPFAHYFIKDTTLADTMMTQVQFCRAGYYSFDLYRNNSFVQSFTQVIDSLLIPLSDSGWYYITNVKDSNQVVGICKDTLYCNKQYSPNALQDLASNLNKQIELQVKSPFSTQLDVAWVSFKGLHKTLVYDLVGRIYYEDTSNENILQINTAAWPRGVYILVGKDSTEQQSSLILKQ